MNAQRENLGGQNWAFGGKSSVVKSLQPHNKKLARAALPTPSSLNDKDHTHV